MDGSSGATGAFFLKSGSSEATIEQIPLELLPLEMIEQVPLV